MPANTFYDATADAEKMIQFANFRQANVKDYPYSLNPFGQNKLNFCDTFAQDMLNAGAKK